MSPVSSHRCQSLIFVLLVTVVAIAGCVPSLNAIYTEEDIAFDEAVVGKWVPDDQDEVWEFTKHSENTYRLMYRDSDNKHGVFEATLVKVGDARFLDLTPLEDPELTQNALWKWHLFSTHTWLLVESTSPSIKLRAMNLNWAKEHLQNHPLALEHVIQNDRVLITAETKDIQEFATLHINTPEAYGEVYTLHKDE
ncbi:MAG: hypothetical protein MPJ50_04315 [Pirellulales bacterium]|nr:hypothetical protein [Pirellulales bacterium]